jgi:3-methylfumaryl-CoA hydratase
MTGRLGAWPQAPDAVMPQPAGPALDGVVVADDVCALPLARRMAAFLDRDPSRLRAGQSLPRGWHVIMFNPPTKQSQLRNDGAAELGIPFPDVGLPRLLFGGRTVTFAGDIPIAATARRETRSLGVQEKHGRSGRFVIVSIEHRIFAESASEPAVVELSNYVMREAAAPGSPQAAASGAPAQARVPDATRVIVPDAPMLFRYSAITDNPHRIHYDLAYATATEGYPGLLVNGSIPSMFLLEMFRALAGREPVRFSSRNLGQVGCGEALRLCAKADGARWLLWAENASGAVALDAEAA